MTREERRRILGDDVIAQIHKHVKEAPEPSDELVEDLRRIMTRPAGPVPKTRVRGCAAAAEMRACAASHESA